MYKNIIIFSVGALIGSLVTYFAVKDKFNKELDEEIESVKKTYERIAESKEKIIALKEAKKEMAENVFGKTYDKTVEELGYQTNYNIFSKPMPEDITDSNNEDDNGVAEEYPSEGIAENPYTISPDMFVNDKKYFDKITLEYYEGNDTLIEEISETPVSVEDSIGRDALRMFGEFEKDLVYVRNERLSTDYEVYHYSGSYFKD